MDTKKIDHTLDWMIKNLPPDRITLRDYVALNWCAEKRLEDLDAEEFSSLPEELFHITPGSEAIQ
jgi:hypothetical protein